MNPGFFTDITSYQGGRTWVDLTWTSAASGALPALSDSGVSAGVTSNTHGATGVYTIVFDGQPYNLINFGQAIQQASYSKTGACEVQLTGFDAPSKTATLLVVDAAGDAVEPASGDVIRLTFTFGRYGS